MIAECRGAGKGGRAVIINEAHVLDCRRAGPILQQGTERRLVVPTAASENERVPRHCVLCGLLLFSAELVIPTVQTRLRWFVGQSSPIFDK
jgi:hypothetical protein